MTAIDDDAHALQSEVTRETIFKKNNISSQRIIDSEGLANFTGGLGALFPLAP